MIVLIVCVKQDLAIGIDERHKRDSVETKIEILKDRSARADNHSIIHVISVPLPCEKTAWSERVPSAREIYENKSVRWSHGIPLPPCRVQGGSPEQRGRDEVRPTRSRTN